MSNIRKEFILFAGVGAIATALQYTVLILLVEIYHLLPVYASCFGYVMGGCFSYIANRYITFKVTGAPISMALKFFCVASSSLGLNYLLMLGLASFFSKQYILSQLFTTFLLLFWNFYANRCWTFR